MKIPYATRYKTTLSQDMDSLASKAYGKNAKPALIADTSLASLLHENVTKYRGDDIGLFGRAWRLFKV